MEIDVKAVHDEIVMLARGEGFLVEEIYGAKPISITGLVRESKVEGAPRVFISAGIHGDEPAGPNAVLRLFETGFFEEGISWYVIPMLNPRGLELGIRENAEGFDLNRDYKNVATQEVAAHIRWFEGLGVDKLDMAFNFHEDWEAEGFYFYSVEKTQGHTLVPEIINAVEAVCPIDYAELIDGMEAKGGVMQLGGDFRKSELYLSQEWPESFYIIEKFDPPYKYTFETPTSRAMEVRVLALCEASKACISSLKRC